MKKIRLDVDSLEVLSFETENLDTGARGTVRGAFNPGHTVGWDNSDCRDLSPTWEDSCGCPDTQGPACDTQVTCLSCLDVSCYLYCA